MSYLSKRIEELAQTIAENKEHIADAREILSLLDNDEELYGANVTITVAPADAYFESDCKKMPEKQPKYTFFTVGCEHIDALTQILREMIEYDVEKHAELLQQFKETTDV